MNDYDDIMADMIRERNNARVQAISGLEGSPDDAARAIELSRVTGQSPSVVLGDLPGQEAAVKRNMANELIRGNQHIQDYINADHIHAQLSSDDYGILDEVSQKLGAFRRLTSVTPGHNILGAPGRVAEGVIGAAARGFVEGAGPGPIGSWLSDDQLKNHPLSSAVLAGTLSPAEAALRIMSGGMRAVTEGVRAGATESYLTITGDEQSANRFGRDISGMAEMQLMGTGVHHMPMAPEAVAKAWRNLESTKLWLDHGVEPPTGLSRDIDKIKLDQNNADVANLDDMLRDAQRSSTRLRDPDTFARFVQMRDDGAISIDAEAVARLYGDKALMADDGLLGWFPGLKDQLEAARVSGGDVEIPLADWLAKVDPEVAKALKDDIRVRPGGITANEAKLATEKDAAWKSAIEEQAQHDREPTPISGAREVIPEDLPQMREAGALEPLFAMGDRALKIEKRVMSPEDINRSIDSGKIPADEFRLMDENGQKVGWLEIVPYDGGKKLYVDNVGGFESKGYGPNSFGPALTRSLIRQLKVIYPEAKQLGGFRISGAREKFDATKEAWINIDKGWDSVDTGNEFRRMLEGGGWERFSPRMEAYIKPSELREGQDRELVDMVNDELDRIVPKNVAVQEVNRLRGRDVAGIKTGKDIEPNGAYIRYRETYPIILWSMEAPDPIGTARHEAIHHLRQYGFFTDAEWITLERASREGKWIEAYGINQRYPTGDRKLHFEESIADAYAAWARGTPASPQLTTIFERIKEFLARIKDRLGELIGKDPSFEDIFQKIHRGEVGSREGTRPMDPRSYSEELLHVSEEGQAQPPPLPETSPRRMFRTPAAVGMTEPQMRLYERRLRDMHAADIAATEARASADQRRRQTKEWKDDFKAVSDEVAADFHRRPDVAADLFFGRGELYEEKLSEKPKLAYEALTPEERAALPKGYVAREGVEAWNPNEIAGLFGFPSGKDLVNELTKYNQSKLAGNMTAKAFLDRQIAMEAERRMQAKHGNLEENILDATKDQVASETQLNLISEEVLALGIRAGSEAPILKPEMRDWFADKFNESPMAGQTSDKYLRAMQKSGSMAELELLRGNFDTAFTAKQQQFGAMLMFKDARALEKEQKAFAKTAKSLSRRDVKSLDQDYHDVIQLMLWQGGLTPRRSMPEIQRSMAQSGHTVESLINESIGDGWAPDVADWIKSGAKPIDSMTVGEFREFKTAIDSMSYIGRQVEKINVRGEQIEFNIFKRGIIENIEKRERIPREKQEKAFFRLLYGMDAALTKSETLFKALDYGEEMGPLLENIARPIAESKHRKYTMQEDLSRQIKSLNAELPDEWRRSLGDELHNDWFRDPSTGEPFKLTRENLINIMLNMGNKGNRRKFVENYGSPEYGRRATSEEVMAFDTMLMNYIHANATSADWKFVQGIWDIYAGYRDGMETIWRHTSGTQPKLIDSIPIDTPHGQFAGGYYPLLEDKYISSSPTRGLTGEGLFSGDYPNFSTPQGHLKERTAANYYVDFRAPLKMIPIRMQQVIHDIAYRDSVMAASKILQDKDIRNAIRNHYGKVYEDQLDPWLRKTARGSTLEERDQSAIDAVLRQTRLNLINYALPLNYVVTATPDVGNFNPVSLSRFWADRAGNAATANRLSKEIPHAIYNMDRDFTEAMNRAVGEGRIDDLKSKTARWGYAIVTKVSQEFRMAEWTAAFNRLREDGKSEADAAAIADTVIRSHFGSAAIHDLPSVMTTGEKGRMLTMFYGYWNTQYNRVRPMADMYRRGEYMDLMATAYANIVIGTAFGAAIANNAHEEDTWWQRTAKAVPLQMLGMIPFARETATLAFDGIPPRNAYGTVIQSGIAVGNDVSRWYHNKPIEAGVKHVAAGAGLIFGVPGTLQLGRTSQGLYDVSRGKQHPRDFMEWIRLVMTGEARLKRRGQR